MVPAVCTSARASMLNALRQRRCIVEIDGVSASSVQVEAATVERPLKLQTIDGVGFTGAGGVKRGVGSTAPNKWRNSANCSQFTRASVRIDDCQCATANPALAGRHDFPRNLRPLLAKFLQMIMQLHASSLNLFQSMLVITLCQITVSSAGLKGPILL